MYSELHAGDQWNDYHGMPKFDGRHPEQTGSSCCGIPGL